ncbi:flavodoxin family protein [Methanobrevibacter sp.]|uniref:flavodoxin family protein n=1 Tax=Methanobrevibacter sp. TaxID=66852 RepID=UPI002616EBC1|nr:flavodoxin [uncultured Methanobrevibacter sp.]
MNILITYYSRTHITEKVALKLKEELNCDLEQIIDKKNRSSFFSYIKSGFEAARKIPADIEETEKNPNEYDLVIIGTPVWSGSMSTPILTYLKQNKDNFNNVAFFCTCGGNEGKTFVNMEELLSKKPLNTLSMNKKDVESSFDSMVTEFVEDIKNNN